MNILFLEGDMSRSGGTERMTALLSGWLAENHLVHILSLGMHGDSVFFPLDRRVSHSALDAGLSSWRKICKIRRFIQEKHIDTVINVDTGMGIFGIPAAWGLKTKVITWEHANFFNNWDSRVFPLIRRFAALFSDHMVVLTERDRENYLAGIKLCRPVTVIPNPAEQHKFSYNTESKVILSAGLLGEIKRFHLIPEIGETIFAKHPDWQWVICGDGPERDRVQTLIQEAGLEKNILLPGKVTDMEGWYRKSALYVMTSRMEGLPMVLLEAQSYGLPLVSFDIMTGPSDIIRDGVNGFLVKDGDLEEMTAIILQLMDSAELRNEFSRNSQIDSDKFSVESVVEKWETLFRSLSYR